MTQFFVYDVFTDHPFGGNQLAVIPDAANLPEDRLQAIAAEFNYSETTFVYPPGDPAHTARVRIFSPTQELPFAGHPTIGTSVALSDEGATAPMVLELGVGPIVCHVTGNAASFATNRPLEILARPDPGLIARALGLDEASIDLSEHVPTHATIGLPFVIAQLTDRAALARCQTDLGAFRDGAQRYPSGFDFAIFAYTRSRNAIQARMFAPLDNIPEDPATGSACALLAAMLDQLTGQRQDLDITQGADMGRPARIRATTDDGDPVTVTIYGKAVRTMEGRLLV